LFFDEVDADDAGVDQLREGERFVLGPQIRWHRQLGCSGGRGLVVQQADRAFQSHVGGEEQPRVGALVQQGLVVVAAVAQRHLKAAFAPGAEAVAKQGDVIERRPPAAAGAVRRCVVGVKCFERARWQAARGGKARGEGGGQRHRQRRRETGQQTRPRGLSGGTGVGLS